MINFIAIIRTFNLDKTKEVHQHNIDEPLLISIEL